VYWSGPSLLTDGSFEQIATASFVKTQIANVATGGFATWNVVDVDADWDDESEQVELRIEAQVSCLLSNQSASINGFALTILAALPAGENLISVTLKEADSHATVATFRAN
jgi:hypothetical protein